MNSVKKNKYGSEWRKWDLHIHTPNTQINDNFKVSNNGDLWDEYCEIIHNSDVEVFGITDYFSVENYFIFIEKFKKKYPASRKSFFPNIELRLEVSVNKKAEEINLHIIFSDKTQKSKIDNFLSKLNTNLPKNGAVLTCKDLTTTKDYQSAGINYKDIRVKLHEVFGDDECYLIFGASNNSGLRPDTNSPRKLIITDVIDQECHGFFGGEQNVGYYLKNNRYEEGKYSKKKPVACGCDAHSFEELKSWLGKRIVKTTENGKIIEKDITWIKADPTFEGLKQIIYEPDARIYIGEDKPKLPINKIESITLKIDNDATVSEDSFCFAGSNLSCNLSPYFNCFIGGRGSGKSTILNFLGLHSNNPDSSVQFWEKLVPSFNPKDINNFSFSGTEIFEFLAQSEIETFAKDKFKFTQAIYDRANAFAGNVLLEYEEKIYSLKNSLNTIVQTIFDLKRINEQITTEEKDKRVLEDSVKVLTSSEFTNIATQITEKSKELKKLEQWQKKVTDLQNALNELVSERNEKIDEHEMTGYEKAYILAVAKIIEAIDLLKDEKFTKDVECKEDLKNTLKKLEDKAKILIEQAGYTPESVEQIKSAPQRITHLEGEITDLKIQKKDKIKIIETLQNKIDELKVIKQNYETKLAEILEPLQNLLKNQYEDNLGKDIKEISLEYHIDEEGAWLALAEEFYENFKNEYGSSERSKEVCDFIIENKNVFKTNSYLDIQNYIRDNENINKKYIKFINDVFKDENNFLIFEAIREQHTNDVKTNKIIQVKYDNKDVENASFGQRCTAVVVILLLFGNYPLIIDEPEGHLDGSLIANYLVPLLKKKKTDRQVIFATHNANFVVNGDSERIFILINSSGQTEIHEATIEDMQYRDELLKLEGGKDAFKMRGEKLHLN